MTENKKIAQVISQLLKETQKGSLKWSVATTVRDLGNSEKRIGSIYTTMLSGKHIYIYKFEYKYFVDEERFEWSDGYTLKFTDMLTNADWEIKYRRELEDLYEAVRYKVANIDDFINGLLPDNDLQEDDPF